MTGVRDLVVIGGGAGGLVVASVAAQLGLGVVLINKEIGINKILSIILFGSQQAGNDNTIISDCDLLFIFKNMFFNNSFNAANLYIASL